MNVGTRSDSEAASTQQRTAKHRTRPIDRKNWRTPSRALARVATLGHLDHSNHAWVQYAGNHLLARLVGLLHVLHPLVGDARDVHVRTHAAPLLLSLCLGVAASVFSFTARFCRRCRCCRCRSAFSSALAFLFLGWWSVACCCSPVVFFCRRYLRWAVSGHWMI